MFTDSFISTIGVDFKIKTITIDGQRVKLQIVRVAEYSPPFLLCNYFVCRVVRKGCGGWAKGSRRWDIISNEL